MLTDGIHGIVTRLFIYLLWKKQNVSPLYGKDFQRGAEQTHILTLIQDKIYNATFNIPEVNSYPEELYVELIINGVIVGNFIAGTKEQTKVTIPFKIVGNENNCTVLPLKIFENIHHHFGVFRVKGTCWFISQNHQRVSNYCSRKGNSLLLSSRQLNWPVIMTFG